MTEEIRNGYEKSDWQKHYDENDLAWDLGEVANPFVRLWKDNVLQPGTLIVPGCGQGHEVIYFAERGFQVTGVDFSPGAVELLSESLSRKNLNAQVLRRNFFELDETHNQTYDNMLEQTFFCAIHKDQRSAYVETVSRILKPGGMLFGLFYETGEEGGPPFNTTEADIQNHFSTAFDIERLEKCSFSSEQRKDKEWLAIMRKKPEDRTG
jgi:cyclopropane fatty-acyl-phospholipid synthase-like methyltransferase